jgi:hypothetical protein
MLLNEYSAAERALTARRLRALADLLKLTPGTVAPSVRALVEAPCKTLAAPTWTGDVAEAALAWIEEGEQPPLSEELRRIFGHGFCECSLPTVPACGAFYVSDAESMREQLTALYQRADFTPPGLSGGCEGVTYISHQLAFLAHCIGAPDGCGDALEAALPILRESLFEWVALFARALVSSTRHPGAVFAGLTLECTLDNDPIIVSLTRSNVA